MSEGDPYKRQKTCDETPDPSDVSTLKLQNSCLGLKLKEQRQEISKLSTLNSELSQKLKSLESFTNTLNINWAKTLSNLNTLCTEFSVPPQKINPFDIFLQDSAGLEQFIELSKKCLNRLLEAVDKVTDYETGAIIENCKENLNINSIQGENMKLKYELSNCRAELARVQNENEELSLKKMNLEVRLVRKGDLNVENSVEKNSEDLQKVKQQKEVYEKLYKDEIQKRNRTQHVEKVSFEQFVRSRGFKDLIRQAKKMKGKMKYYRDKCEDLCEYRENFREKLKKECERIMENEGKKRDELEKKLKKVTRESFSLETSKNEAIQELELQKKLQTETKRSNVSSNLIEILSNDKDSLKKKNLKLKSKLDEVSKKLEDYESGQKFASTDSEMQKLNKLLEDYRKKLKSEQQNSENLIKEIEVAENAYEKIEEKIKTLTTQLAQQEELYNKLMREKVKEGFWKQVHDQETALFESKIKSLAETVALHEELQKEYEQKLKGKQDQIDSLCNKCKELENKVKDVNEKHEESIMKVEELLGYKNDYVAGLKRAEESLAEVVKEKLEIETRFQEKEEELKELQSRIERDSKNLKSTDEILNKEVAYYRKMIKCSVCCNRNKDTILSKCLHGFCKECLLDCLQNRKRKCPLCKNRFNQDDMKNFTWDTA